MEKPTKGEIQEILHEQISSRRQSLHMTQEELANSADTSLANLKKIEQGRGMPKIETLVGIAFALNVPIDTLLLGKEGPPNVFPAIESLYIRLSPAGRQTLNNIAKELLALELELKKQGRVT